MVIYAILHHRAIACKKQLAAIYDIYKVIRFLNVYNKLTFSIDNTRSFFFGPVTYKEIYL